MYKQFTHAHACSIHSLFAAASTGMTYTMITQRPAASGQRKLTAYNTERARLHHDIRPNDVLPPSFPLIKRIISEQQRMSAEHLTIDKVGKWGCVEYINIWPTMHHYLMNTIVTRLVH